MSSLIGSKPSDLTIEQKFDSVQSNIDELITATDHYLKQELPNTFRERLVYNSYNLTLDEYRDHFYRIHIDDVVQQVRLAYYNVLSRYFKRADRFSEKQFKVKLDAQVTWDVRGWLKSQLRKFAREVLESVLPSSPSVTQYKEINLGPGFLMNGQGVYPYNLLSNYDRLLIHLAFYEDMSDSQMGRVLQRDRILVRRDIDRILEFLRRSYEQG